MSEIAAETPDPVSPALLDLLAVFEGPLAEVQFPGVSSTSLRALVDQMRADARELDVLRAQLDTLHGRVTEARTRLLRAAEQGLGYARVYAADDPDLSARLADITLSTGKPAEPRRRKADKLQAAPGLNALETPADASPSESDDGTAEPLRLPPRRGRKPRALDETPTGS